MTGAEDVERDHRCPDCGGPITELYCRPEFDTPMVTFWCEGDCGVSKAAPKEDLAHAA